MPPKMGCIRTEPRPPYMNTKIKTRAVAPTTAVEAAPAAER